MDDVMTFSRVLPFEGIHNFRDYGGYPARGGRLRERLLYRSAQHRDATDADLARVAKLGLGVVIDLRGNMERTMSPCPRPVDFAARVVTAGGETVDPAMAPVAHVRSFNNAAAAQTRMTALYRDLPFHPVLVDTFRAYFAALADSDTPNLIHCVAGKDRTGVGVALFHRMLGVHGDDIMADYLLTNTAGNVEARLAAGAHHLRAAYGAGIADDSIRALMSVRAEYLDAAFSAIDALPGGFDAYVADNLGVSPAMLIALETRLIA
jgi:protein-tyrosine phosphatase